MKKFQTSSPHCLNVSEARKGVPFVLLYPSVSSGVAALQVLMFINSYQIIPEIISFLTVVQVFFCYCCRVWAFGLKDRLGDCIVVVEAPSYIALK